jgi:hyaluronoglucosaminidase
VLGVLAGTLGAPPSPAGAAGHGATAYVAEGGTAHGVLTVDAATASAGQPVSTGSTSPVAVVVTPDGKQVLVVTIGSEKAGLAGYVIPVNAGQRKAGPPIRTGADPQSIVVTPDGSTAYVLNGNIGTATAGTVTPIHLSSATAGAPIAVGSLPYAMDLAPNGRTLYVTDETAGGIGGPSTITPVNTATNTPEATIDVPALALAILPDSKTLYAVSNGAVVPINAATGAVGSPIKVNASPQALLALPNGKTVYVLSAPTPGLGSHGATTLTPIDTATNRAGKPISLPGGPNPTTWSLAAAANSKTVYVLYSGPPKSHGILVPVDTGTGTVDSTIPVGKNAFHIVIEGTDAFVLNQGVDQSAIGKTKALHSASSVTVINTSTNSAGATVPVGLGASAIAVAG